MPSAPLAFSDLLGILERKLRVVELIPASCYTAYMLPPTSPLGHFRLISGP